MGYLKKIIKKIVPLTLRQSFRINQSKSQSIIRQAFLRIFEKNKLCKITGAHLLLNIGCGELPRAGWINIDINPCRGVYYSDVARSIPLRNESVRHIHCEHLLEHLDYEGARKFLAECLRILEKGGSLRLILPDAEKYLRAYCQNDKEFFEEFKNLGGGGPFRTRLEIINQMFRMGGAHKFAWDLEVLSMVLKEIGFTKVEKSRFGGDMPPDLCIDLTDSWRPVESLYVNVYK